MKTNTVATLYHYENNTYTRVFIGDVMWDEEHYSNVIQSGLLNADSTIIYVPYKEIQFTVQKDIVVNGICDYEFELSDISKGIKTLKELGGVTIHTCDKKIVGSPKMWHYVLSCK